MTAYQPEQAIVWRLLQEAAPACIRCEAAAEVLLAVAGSSCCYAAFLQMAE